MKGFPVDISGMSENDLAFFGFMVVKEDSDSMIIEHVREGYFYAVDKNTMILPVHDLNDAKAMGF